MPRLRAISRFAPLLTLSLSLLSVAACEDIAPPTGPTRGSALDAISQVPPGATDDRLLGLDERFLLLAESIPGFAGFMLDNANTSVVVMLTDLSQSATARSVLSTALRSFSLGGGRTFAELPIIFVPAKYDWKQLAAFKTALLQEAAKGGVISFDIDESANRVELGVVDESTRQRILNALPGLDVPLSAIHVFLDAAVIEQMPTINDPAPAMLAGYSIEYENIGRCTSGFLAYYHTSPLLTRVLVTAAHCSPNVGVIDPGSVYQPTGAHTTRRIGSETRDRAPFSCIYYSRCRYSDAAYIAYQSIDIPFDWGYGARTQFDGQSSGSSTISGYFDFGERTTPVMNQQMSKVGIGRGWVSGPVLDTGLDFYQPVRDLWYLGFASVDYGCAAGDSGAPVFTAPTLPSGGEVVATAGIHHGLHPQTLRCVFSTITNVERDNGTISEYSD